MNNKAKFIKIFKTYLFLIIVPFAFLIGFFMGAGKTNGLSLLPFSSSVFNKATSNLVDKKIDFNIFWQEWEIIKQKYFHQPVDEKNMLSGAMSGLAASLNDPYTVYFDPETTKAFNNELSGTFEGIGIEIGIKKDKLIVISALTNSPAEKEGILAGDKILEIDGKITISLSIDNAVNLIRGKGGTKVTLLIERNDQANPLSFTITREVIKVNSVTWKIIKENITYLQISEFNDDTAKNFENIVRQIILKNPQGIILDLRNNPGGVLDAAVRICSYFIPQDQIVLIEDFGGGKRNEYKSKGYDDLNKYPLVILVNEGSASASEIVAGALQDYKIGTIIGKQTYGKGSVQELEDFSDGSSLKISVAQWLTPQGRSINDQGIKPDQEIELTKSNYDNDQDPQLDKAIEILLTKIKI